MKKNKLLLPVYLISVVLILNSCASVPKQVATAMEKQKEEIARVKLMYFSNMNNQLNSIEKYQLAILAIYEEQLRAKASKALDLISVNGTPEIKEVAPTGDKDVDYININKLEAIDTFFNEERKKVRDNIKLRRIEIYKIAQNFKNIEEINLAVDDYLNSLVTLKESRDKLAKSIKNRIEKLVPIPINLPKLPDPTTIEEILSKLKK